MSKDQENKRELNEEETGMVTGGTEPQPMEERLPNGNPAGIPVEDDPSQSWGTHLYKCTRCDFRLTTNSINNYTSCPNCHQRASWSDLGAATAL